MIITPNYFTPKELLIFEKLRNRLHLKELLSLIKEVSVALLPEHALGRRDTLILVVCCSFCVFRLWEMLLRSDSAWSLIEGTTAHQQVGIRIIQRKCVKQNRSTVVVSSVFSHNPGAFPIIQMEMLSQHSQYLFSCLKCFILFYFS